MDERLSKEQAHALRGAAWPTSNQAGALPSVVAKARLQQLALQLPRVATCLLACMLDLFLAQLAALQLLLVLRPRHPADAPPA